jgi:hypothetical protein
LGIGDWGLGPIPNPQSPIPNPQSPIPIEIYKNKFYILENPSFYLIIILIYFVFKYNFQYNIKR